MGPGSFRAVNFSTSKQLSKPNQISTFWSSQCCSRIWWNRHARPYHRCNLLRPNWSRFHPLTSPLTQCYCTTVQTSRPRPYVGFTDNYHTSVNTPTTSPSKSKVADDETICRGVPPLGKPQVLDICAECGNILFIPAVNEAGVPHQLRTVAVLPKVTTQLLNAGRL